MIITIKIIEKNKIKKRIIKTENIIKVNKNNGTNNTNKRKRDKSTDNMIKKDNQLRN